MLTIEQVKEMQDSLKNIMQVKEVILDINIQMKLIGSKAKIFECLWILSKPHFDSKDEFIKFLFDKGLNELADRGVKAFSFFAEGGGKDDNF